MTATVLLVIFLWKVPQWQVGHLSDIEPKERFKLENDARKTLAQIVGGIVVLASFYATYQNITLAQKSLSIAQDSTSISQKSLIVSQEGQVTDRFSKAIEQLGAVDVNGKKKLEVRLGAIYALERIARESERDYWPVIGVLTAYVRENAPRKRQEAAAKKDVPADIQAILTVISRRDIEHEKHLQQGTQLLDLHQTDLHRVYLRAANLSGVDLRGVDLRGSILLQADLSEATFTGADLRGADLRAAKLCEVGLSMANLNGADLRGANLRGADLEGADLRAADLSQAHFIAASLSRADLQGARLVGADLIWVDLRKAFHLTQLQIAAAIGDLHTQLPPNLHMPEIWKQGPHR